MVMATEPKAPAVEELHILWISEGMSCDGDSVSITAAGQPSIEDVLLGAIPGLPKVNLHNKVLSPTLGGDDFLVPFREAIRGELDAPFVVVMEGSIPNEKINGEGYWAVVRQRRGRRSSRSRPAGGSTGSRPKAWACRRDRDLRHLRRHPRHGGQPHRLHGPRPTTWAADFRSAGGHADRQRARLPGAARQLHGDAALAALSARRARTD